MVCAINRVYVDIESFQKLGDQKLGNGQYLNLNKVQYRSKQVYLLSISSEQQDLKDLSIRLNACMGNMMSLRVQFVNRDSRQAVSVRPYTDADRRYTFPEEIDKVMSVFLQFNSNIDQSYQKNGFSYSVDENAPFIPVFSCYFSVHKDAEPLSNRFIFNPKVTFASRVMGIINELQATYVIDDKISFFSIIQRVKLLANAIGMIIALPFGSMIRIVCNIIPCVDAPLKDRMLSVITLPLQWIAVTLGAVRSILGAVVHPGIAMKTINIE